jgi:ribose-phosphate pyrophosphokinase
MTAARDPIVLAGSGNPALAQAVAHALGQPLGRAYTEAFPDGELHVELGDTVSGRDVYVVQPTGPPVEAHLFELLLLGDACRRAGAAELTAVIPYFGYARQDRRATGREALGARVAADVIAAAGFTRVVAVDLHNAAIEGCFTMPLEHQSAVGLLAETLAEEVTDETVVVAPDLGAAKMAERYARLFHRPVAIVHKTRLSGSEVRVHAVVGEVAGRAPILVDDMISTGATIEAAAWALLDAGCRPRLVVAATHLLFVGGAAERLGRLPIARLAGTDSVVTPDHAARVLSSAAPPITRVSIAPLVAETIVRLHEHRAIVEVEART